MQKQCRNWLTNFWVQVPDYASDLAPHFVTVGFGKARGKAAEDPIGASSIWIFRNSPVPRSPVAVPPQRASSRCCTVEGRSVSAETAAEQGPLGTQRQLYYSPPAPV